MRLYLICHLDYMWFSSPPQLFYLAPIHISSSAAHVHPPPFPTSAQSPGHPPPKKVNDQSRMFTKFQRELQNCKIGGPTSQTRSRGWERVGRRWNQVGFAATLDQQNKTVGNITTTKKTAPHSMPRPSPPSSSTASFLSRPLLPNSIDRLVGHRETCINKL